MLVARAVVSRTWRKVIGCVPGVVLADNPIRGALPTAALTVRRVRGLAVLGWPALLLAMMGVRQAWIEDERLYIQTELCETCLEKQMENGQRLDIPGVYAFLRQTLLGLEILHRHKLVHLDIKVSGERVGGPRRGSGVEGG